MTAHFTATRTTNAAPRPRSRLRARIVLAGLSACGFAALAWAAFVQPLPRLIYNPSDSVAVGWYRVDPLDHRAASLPRPVSVDSIVLVPLPAEVAALAAQRGYLPTRVPLLKRVGAVAPQEVCIDGGIIRIDGAPVAAVLRADRLGRPLPSWQQCHRLAPDELFLLSVTNPASFDSRYFGPVSASTVIGVAHPVWLETCRCDGHHVTALHRAIRRVLRLAVAVSLRRQCERIRVALRATSGAATPCADVLPRTRPAGCRGRVRRWAGCKQRSAAGPPTPEAEATGKGGRQDKRSRHHAA